MPIYLITDSYPTCANSSIFITRSSNDIPAVFAIGFFNADGSEVEQCGNGARCFALFVREKKLTDKERILVETKKA